jgi:AbrB family looped-hinge helix DNA binding protein
MEVTSVTSKGRVTIPKELRQRLGIRQGSRIEFSLVAGHVEMRVWSSPSDKPRSGFGMLKSRRTAVPAHVDPAMCSTIEHPKCMSACAARPQGRELR